MGGGGGMGGALLGAGITALADRAGGSPPGWKGYAGGRHNIHQALNWGLGDIKALREGGINDPRLDYLGLGKNYQQQMLGKLRDESQGNLTAGEQQISDASRGYGGAPAASGRVMANIGKLRATRELALDAAGRDLALENVRMKQQNFQQMGDRYQGWFNNLVSIFNRGADSRYNASMQRWLYRKHHYQVAGQALNQALGTGGMTGGGNTGAGQSTAFNSMGDPSSGGTAMQ